jgi:hypothetical protein
MGGAYPRSYAVGVNWILFHYASQIEPCSLKWDPERMTRAANPGRLIYSARGKPSACLRCGGVLRKLGKARRHFFDQARLNKAPIAVAAVERA